MTKSDQAQNLLNDFQQASEFRQYRFRKTLDLVIISFVLLILAGFGFLSFKAGNFYSVFFYALFSVLMLIRYRWIIRKNPKEYMEITEPKPHSFKEILWWGGIITFIICLSLFR